MADKTGFDTVTRIVEGDDGSSYDRVAIFLHWTTAALVVAQITLAQTWDWFAKPTRELMENTHMSFGVLLTAAVAAEQPVLLLDESLAHLDQVTRAELKQRDLFAGRTLIMVVHDE